MNTDEAMVDLTGQYIIAMPDMNDPRFSGSVVLICAHSDEGTMGLIVNKPVEDVSLADLLTQLDLPASSVPASAPLHFGGPVEAGRGFVLHGPDYTSDLSDLQINAVFSLTSTLDILEDVSKGIGPEKAIFALGYSGWGAGQLESEIALNGWLVAPADPSVVFDLPDQEKWAGAIRSLGIDPSNLSITGGNA